MWFSCNALNHWRGAHIKTTSGKMYRATASSAHGVHRLDQGLTLLVGLVYLWSSGALAALTHCSTLYWSSTMTCMLLFRSMARDRKPFSNQTRCQAGVRSCSHPLCNFLYCTAHTCLFKAIWWIIALSHLWEIVWSFPFSCQVESQTTIHPRTAVCGQCCLCGYLHIHTSKPLQILP